MTDVQGEPAELAHQTTDRCDLRLAATSEIHRCDGEDCVYWRVLEHVGIDCHEKTGCAVRYFGMLEGAGPEVGVWLLSVKRRVEALEAEQRDPTGHAPTS